MSKHSEHSSYREKLIEHLFIAGYKAERPGIRTLNKGNFSRYETIRDIYDALFGIDE